MRLHSISVRNFRRLKSIDLDFEEKETVFVGPNNSGKTSATAVMRSFLGNRDFKVHDFSVSSISAIDAYVNGEEQSLPSIDLDLWFKVDPDAVSFGRVFALATTLSTDFSEIGIRCALTVDDVNELWRQYDLAFPVDQNGERKRSLSHFLDLEGNLKKHFSVQFSSLERTDNDLLPTPLDPKDGKKILSSLVRVDFVDAQRNIDDENAARSNRLSEAFATYYRRNLEKAELAEEAIAIIEQNNENLNSHYSQRFAPLMTMIGGLGLPSDNDRAMKVVSTLSSEDALRGNTELFYVDANTSHELPEAYNGLGFKNLVFMAIQIDHFYRQWLATEEDRPLCQVIFVEEPEVHLHAQVQQTFIRQMWDVLTEGRPDGESTPQLAVTTHSSHILDTVDFSKIRYFRRKSINDVQNGESFHGTTVHSLAQFQPEPIDLDGEVISPEAALSFLKKYLRLTHCDLFFSDAAILVEGSVEKLLLPRMIDFAANSLNKKYLTVLEVGGAYGMRFAGLLEFLEIPYLIITDIDSVDPANSRKNCIATADNAVSSNATLGYFFDDSSVKALAAKTKADREQADGMRFISYQTPVSIDVEGQAQIFHGRTLEETFVYENLVLFRNDALSIGIDLPDDLAALHQDVWKRIKSSTFKKTEFAMNVLAYEPPQQQDEEEGANNGVAQLHWNVPQYIFEGLVWLDGQLSQNAEEA
ncbi:ATP-dependent nuclease [Leisingera aquaemixtae]|uniref:Recombination protein F n=1 Tax=Leisingera aquaemixtae TaxID=1396826 RepID=A0A0P1HDU4_9RHOB|nr:AAA family ATPase [Leisingera aquaemixtae]CUI01878.1 recombination protein F [Leisingera aquaemixtae]